MKVTRDIDVPDHSVGGIWEHWYIHEYWKYGWGFIAGLIVALLLILDKYTCG